MILSYVAALFSFIGIVLNIKKNPYCWWLFICSDSLWLCYFGITKQIAPLIIYLMFMGANVFGLYNWFKK
jgi:nitrate reductase gamma subunit